MDIENLHFAKGSTKFVTGKMLDESGCPFCNCKGHSDSTRAFLREELPTALQSCGNVFIFVCKSCQKRSIAMESLPTGDQQETLREMVATHYGGVADDRLMFVTLLQKENR